MVVSALKACRSFYVSESILSEQTVMKNGLTRSIAFLIIFSLPYSERKESMILSYVDWSLDASRGFISSDKRFSKTPFLIPSSLLLPCSSNTVSTNYKRSLKSVSLSDLIKGLPISLLEPNNLFNYSSFSIKL